MSDELDQRTKIAFLSDGDIREQLCNWLKLLMISGVNEVFVNNLKTGNDRETSGMPESILKKLKEEVDNCSRCVLHKHRRNAVFGEGNIKARLMFIGEAPGKEEDIQGRPFVGMAGRLLTKIIEAMGLTREEVYITNVVKCRPPNNRVPDLDEIAACLIYLEKQIHAIRPEVICTLGSVATRTLTGITDGITSLRGRFYDYMDIPVMPTFHPAACLRKPEIKRLVWDDIKKVMRLLHLPTKGVIRDGSTENNA